MNRAGVVYCLDANTWEQKYAQRIKQSCWATPIAMGDRIYFFGKEGITTVIAAGPEFKELATNELWPTGSPPSDNALPKLMTLAPNVNKPTRCSQAPLNTASQPSMVVCSFASAARLLHSREVAASIGLLSMDGVDLIGMSPPPAQLGEVAVEPFRRHWGGAHRATPQLTSITRPLRSIR